MGYVTYLWNFGTTLISRVISCSTSDIFIVACRVSTLVFVYLTDYTLLSLRV